MPPLTPDQIMYILMALSFFAGAATMFALVCHLAFLNEVAKQEAVNKVRARPRMELEADQEHIDFALANAIGVLK